jgi:hypothetical protein
MAVTLASKALWTKNIIFSERNIHFFLLQESTKAYQTMQCATQQKPNSSKEDCYIK